MNAKDEAAKLVTGLHHAILRVSRGRVLGRIMGMPTVVLETTGRKSGQTRRTMLTAPVVDGDTVVLVASYGGDDRHPAWYLNLTANPDVTVELAGRRREMRARTATAEEKAALWPRITKAYKGYAGYQRRTDRDIPVVLLTPR
ncbi:MAG TPA: nitroreductase family deazaflavin-dependent oxidoreductase [Frankiaceae bacterium]|nr:nitroreductase family deazaflavin-dependent oxidoreductase [Frankiaceae bacterium]